MVGRFKEQKDASRAREVIDRMTRAVERELSEDRLEPGSPPDRFSDEMRTFLLDNDLVFMTPHEVEQFAYDVAVEAKDDQTPSQPIPIEDQSAVDECTEVAARHTLDIERVGTVYLLLGGGASDAGEVTLVVEHGDHHDD